MKNNVLPYYVLCIFLNNTICIIVCLFYILQIWRHHLIETTIPTSLKKKKQTWREPTPVSFMFYHSSKNDFKIGLNEDYDFQKLKTRRWILSHSSSETLYGISFPIPFCGQTAALGIKWRPCQSWTRYYTVQLTVWWKRNQPVWMISLPTLQHLWDPRFIWTQ